MLSKLAETLRDREDGHAVADTLNETVEKAAEGIAAMTPDRAMALALWMQKRDRRWTLLLSILMARAAQGVENEE